jgi:type 1 glutamine amidotransferase
MLPSRIDACLVAGGKYHDLDFARLQILTLLGEQPRIRTRVREDYRDVAGLLDCDMLVTYTVDLVPDEATARSLEDWVGAGHRWLALHGTNSILEWSKPDRAWKAPRTSASFMRLLGSQFLAHPPIAPYHVEVVRPAHPLVAGIAGFDADDELYLCELHPPIEVLLQARWTGETPDFVDRDWARDEPRPVMYLKRTRDGEVLYLTLGHARGHYDMQPLMKEYPQVERGSWKSPEFTELLRRSIAWAARIGEE